MKKRISLILASVVVTGLILFARHAYAFIPRSDPTQEDIYYTYLDSTRLLHGENPYARVLEGDMRTNDKYSTYFPLFYQASWVSLKLGLTDFDDWISAWQKIFNAFNYLIALLLFYAFARRNLEWGGVVAAGFWLFNRYTLYGINVSNLDFLPIFFMLAGLMLFPRRKWLAMFLFSISLGLKQFAIFLAPLFGIWMYIAEEDHWQGIKQALLSTAVVASVPFFSSLPFLLWNGEGFVKSILFSATRLASTHSNLNVESLDALMGWDGLSARIPMLLLMLGVYGMAFKGIGRKYLPVVFIFRVFMSFNAVLYNQYLTWLVAPVPLLVLDYLNLENRGFQASIRWLTEITSDRSGQPTGKPSK